MNTRTKQQGSAQIVVIILLVVALLGSLGFIAWQNFFSKNATTTQTQTQLTQREQEQDGPAEDTVGGLPENGTITGSLTYPSDVIPDDITIYAENLETGEQYITSEHLKDAKYEYGVGYELGVRPGSYNVYGVRKDFPDTRAYYNVVITCGIRVECTDTTPIEVTVDANEVESGVTVGDWWSIQ